MDLCVVLLYSSLIKTYKIMTGLLQLLSHHLSMRTFWTLYRVMHVFIVKIIYCNWIPYRMPLRCLYTGRFSQFTYQGEWRKSKWIPLKWHRCVKRNLLYSGSGGSALHQNTFVAHNWLTAGYLSKNRLCLISSTLQLKWR